MKILKTLGGGYDLTVPNSERREEGHYALIPLRREEVGRHFLEEVLYG